MDSESGHPEFNVRVMHLLNGEFFSGVEQVVMTLMRYRKRVEAEVLCLMKGEMIRRASGEIGLTVLPMRSRFDFTVLKGLADFIRANRIHLIHAHTLRANLLGSVIGRILGLPVIVTIHSFALRESTHSLRNFRNGWIERLLASWVTAYITVSESLREELERRGVNPSRIHVIRNGIDVQRYSRGDRSSIRRSLGLDAHQSLIGTIALLRPRKGMEYLLQAMGIVAKRMPEARCVIVGDAADADYGNSLLALREELGIAHSVQFVPFRDDIPNLLSAMDIFVLPSLFGEGLPLVILEAMAAAKPVITTRVEGNREAVIENETGLFVPPRDPEALARAAIELISNPIRREAMGQRGRQTALVQFNGARMAEETENLYYDVWSRGRHGRLS